MTTAAKPSRRQISLYFLVFICLFLGAISLPRGPFVLVITDPRYPPAHMLDVIGRAGGELVLPGALSWLAVAHSDAADFPARLRRAGAILVFDHVLAAGCYAGV